MEVGCRGCRKSSISLSPAEKGRPRIFTWCKPPAFQLPEGERAQRVCLQLNGGLKNDNEKLVLTSHDKHHTHTHTHTPPHITSHHTHTVCLCLPVFRSAVYHASSTPSHVGVSVGGTCPVDTVATGAATRGTVSLKRQSASNPAPISGRLVATGVLQPATQAGPVPAQCARRRSESA